MRTYRLRILRFDAEIENFLNDMAAEGYVLHSLTPRAHGDKMADIIVVMVKQV